MTVFGSFMALKPEDKKLVLKTFFLNYYVRIITWIYPFQKVRKIANDRGKHHKKNQIELSRLIWAVNVTSHYVLRSTCLTKALTAQILAEQFGYNPTLRIGVMKDEEEFEAHAWLEYEGEVVLGDSEKEYVPLVNIE